MKIIDTPIVKILFVLLALGATVAPIPAAAQTAATPAGGGAKQEEEDELTDRPNTGYVESAVVGNRFTLRLDAARDADRPDRAEFFYAKCGCFRNPDLEPVLGAAFDPTAPGPGSLPEDRVDYSELELTAEWAFAGNRFSLFAELPIRAIDLGVNDVTSSGIGDVRAGAKLALQRTADRHLTFQLRAYLPTGEARDGLGTDHTSLEPGLLYYQRLQKGWNLGAELKYWHPTSGSSAVGLSSDSGDEFSGDILRYGFGVARDLNRDAANSLSPVIEVVGWNVLDGFKTPGADGEASADGDSIVNLKIGARFRGSWPGSFYLGYGRALTSDAWYDEVFRFEYRRGLGG